MEGRFLFVVLLLSAFVFQCSKAEDSVKLNFNFNDMIEEKVVHVSHVSNPDRASEDHVSSFLSPPENAVYGDLLETIVTTTPTFAKLLTFANLASNLKNGTAFTVFVPTEGALAALDLKYYLSSSGAQALKTILSYHILPGRLSTADFATTSSAVTNTGDSVTVLGLSVEDAKITSADHAAINGFVHVISKVLLPPRLRQSTVLDVCANQGGTNFTALARKSGFSFAASATYTLFCPTDSAFSLFGATYVDSLSSHPRLAEYVGFNLLSNSYTSKILMMEAGASSAGKQYTTQSGANLTVTYANTLLKVNDVLVRVYDVRAGNGIVHMVDRLILPPFMSTSGIETAKQFGHNLFYTLVSVVPNLLESLSSSGPWTLFVPQNSAVASVNPPADMRQLTLLLTYHVVGGAFRSEDLTGSIPSQSDRTPLNFTTTAGQVKVNDANVVVANVIVGNGVLHVIDKVLVPPTVSRSSLSKK